MCFSRFRSDLKSAELKINFNAWDIDRTDFSTKHSNHKHAVEELGQHCFWCPQFGTVSFWLVILLVEEAGDLCSAPSCPQDRPKFSACSCPNKLYIGLAQTASVQWTSGWWKRVRLVPVLTVCYWHSKGGSHWGLWDLGCPLEVSWLTVSRTDLLNSGSCF